MQPVGIMPKTYNRAADENESEGWSDAKCESRNFVIIDNDVGN